MMFTLRVIAYKSWIKRFKVYAEFGTCNFVMLNLQTSLVLLIPNCTRQRMITYTNSK